MEADNLQRKSEAESVAKKVDGLTVPVIRAAGESGQLYGSVTARDIAEAIISAGVTVTRQQVMLDRALKTLGLEEIKVVLHPEVLASVVVNIARSQDEAEQQAHLGRAVGVDELDQDDDDDDGDDLDALLATVDSDGRLKRPQRQRTRPRKAPPITPSLGRQERRLIELLGRRRRPHRRRRFFCARDSSPLITALGITKPLKLGCYFKACGSYKRA